MKNIRYIVIFLLACHVGMPLDNAEGGTLYTTSFESPVVSGRSIGRKVPDGWSGESSYYAGNYGLENTNSGNYTTPYGAQAAALFHASASFTMNEGAATSPYPVLTTGVTYTVSFNVALPSDQTDGDYLVELVAFDPLEARNGNDLGTLLASTNGTAALSDMSESDSFTFSADASNPNLYKLLGLRLDGALGRALIDNIALSDDASGDVYPPIVLRSAPIDNLVGVSPTADLALKFSESISKGAGNIVIKKSSDDSTVETIDVASGSVTASGSTLTIDRSVILTDAVGYYVQADAGIVVDGSGNDCPGISDKTTLNFTVTANGVRELFTDSFESPVVSGANNQTAPDDWNRETSGSLNYWKGCGLSNTNGGTFLTPYGDQAASIWSRDGSLTLKESSLSHVIEEGITYTVTYCYTRGSNLNGAYTVELLAFNPSDVRDDFQAGTLLASKSGTAYFTDMIETAAVSFTPGAGDPSIGKLLAVQIQTSGALIDNLTLSDDTPPAGTVFIIR